MKLIINIDENDKKYIDRVVDNSFLVKPTVDAILNAVRSGTPLPKGHGRLIDADAYLKKVCTYKETGCGSCRFQTVCPVDELTVIEAESEDKE